MNDINTFAKQTYLKLKTRTINCYDCGINLTKENATSEHIPAKNFYAGVPFDFKQNLITVSSCYFCNHKSSSIDGEIRDMIGILNDSVTENQEITRKAVRTILQKKTFVKRLNFDFQGRVSSVTFDLKASNAIHAKTFKGVFFREFKVPIPKNFDINLIVDAFNSNNQQKDLAIHFKSFLENENIESQFSGHPDVFKYLISGFAFDKKNKIVKCNQLKRCIGFVSLLIYHKKIEAIVFCGRNDLIKKWDRT